MGLKPISALVMLLASIYPAAALADGSRSIKEVLHGRVESMKGRRVTVVYDFKSELQLLDFEAVNPFTAPAKGVWHAQDGALVIDGSGAFRWKPALASEVNVKLRVSPKEGRDAGIVLVEPELTNRCVVFALADTFFSKKDRARTYTHMINCCGVPERESSQENVFRYVDRAWTPVITPGQAVDVEVYKVKDRNRMVFQGTTLEGRDVGISLPRLQVALYVLEAGASFSSLRIEAILDTEWLRANDIAYDADRGDSDPKPDEPVAEEPAREPGADPYAQVKAWLRIVGDLEADAREREDAAQKIIDRKRLGDIPHVVMSGILYSGDEATRELATKILKGVAGKTLGYSPSLDADRRKDAVGKWWAWIRQNRSKIDKEEADAAGGGR